VHGSSDACAEGVRPWLEAGATFVQSPLARLPSPDGGFDLVLAFRLLPHLTRWRELVGELCRVARRAVVADYPTRRSVNVVSESFFGMKKGVEGSTRPFRVFGEGEIEAAFAERGATIAALLIEPMQGEGGDNHFRPEFLQALRRVADEREALLVLDEVQTGFYGSGAAWMWQQKGAAPDVVAFGKKTQVCGLYAGPRVDDVADNVFKVPSRINSTWGGNLADMVRSRRFIELILANDYAGNVAEQGARLIDGLRNLGKERGVISNVRGVGSLVAFTLEGPEARAKMLTDLRAQRLLALASGESSIRFRLPLIVSAAEIDLALTKIAACLPSRRKQAV
jgi:acetylornithine/succinyldiaminopimelate/putrescine aminotransferase